MTYFPFPAKLATEGGGPAVRKQAWPAGRTTQIRGPHHNANYCTRGRADFQRRGPHLARGPHF